MRGPRVSLCAISKVIHDRMIWWAALSQVIPQNFADDSAEVYLAWSARECKRAGRTTSFRDTIARVTVPNENRDISSLPN